MISIPITGTMKYLPAVYDQQDQGSCVENDISADVQRILLQAGIHDFTPPSRDGLYVETLIAQGTPGIDFGSIPKVALQVARDVGLPPEVDMPYAKSDLSITPSTSMLSDASQFRILGWHSLNIFQGSPFLASDIATEISHGCAVECAASIHNGFFYETPSNFHYDNSGPVVGGHSFLLDGVEPSIDPANYGHVQFDVRNSWGVTWGKGGQGIIDATQLSLQPSGLYDTSELDVLDGVVYHGRTIDIKWTPERALAAQDFLVLDRAAGPGVYYFADRIASGESQAHILDDIIINSAEGRAMYAGQTDAQFVADMFQDFFGRDPKASGLAYWTGVAASGVTRGALADMIVHGVAAGSDDAAALSNRALVSGVAALAYQNQNADAAASHAVLVGVNSSYASTQSALDTFHHTLYGY